MCTVSIVALPSARPAADRFLPYRMMCNRDESPARAAARAPAIERIGSRSVLLPRDPEGGGTWIAANDAGLTVTLLNYNLPLDARPARRPEWISRGTIIPMLIGSATTASALAALDLLQPATTAPFRLVLLDGQQRGVVVSDGRTLQKRCVPRNEPVVFASSGLGDEVVAGPRSALFDELVAARTPADQPAAQEDFHRHSWPDARHISVCMWREQACTVSCTMVTVTAEAVTMRYLPAAPDQPGTWDEVSLPRIAAR